MAEDAPVPEQLEKTEKTVTGNRGGCSEIDMKILPKVEVKSEESRTNGVKYSPFFMNMCSFIFKSLQVFWLGSEVELLPVWIITHLLRFSVGFPGVFHFPGTPPEHAGSEEVSPKTDAAGADLDVDEAQMLNQIASSVMQCSDALQVQPTGILRCLQSPLVSPKQPTEDRVRLFTPELVESCAEDRDKEEYRFQCPHAGHFRCKWTNLVFEMKGKGEVLYRIVYWDQSVLDGLGQQEPAGPLYSIECLKGSILHLHLPHCETRTDVVKLTVAHVTDGNLEIIQPLEVTDTHVNIQVHGLSLFGLLKALLYQAYPTRAQVLLFYKQVTIKDMKSKLNIHLLPGNVPVKEVQKQRDCSQYVETSSRCRLTPGKTYKPCCKTTDREYVSQPEDETFDCDYGPNYHPTFEVLFHTEVDQVTLSLVDENDQEVWRPRQILLTGPASTKLHVTGADFVDKHRETLIQRVASVMEIADGLRSRGMITDEMYSNIQAAATLQDKMRKLYTCLTGRKVKAEFCKILREKQPCLVKELESGSDQD